MTGISSDLSMKKSSLCINSGFFFFSSTDLINGIIFVHKEGFRG